jgi:hypothetical protein
MPERPIVGEQPTNFSRIGQGAFGWAYEFSVDAVKYVLKAFYWRDLPFSAKYRQGFLMEVNSAAFLQRQHPDQARLFAPFYYADLENRFMVTRHIAPGSLSQGPYRHNCSGIPEYLQSTLGRVGFVHGDLQFDNVHGDNIIDYGGLRPLNMRWGNVDPKFDFRTIRTDQGVQVMKLQAAAAERYLARHPTIFGPFK